MSDYRPERFRFCFRIFRGRSFACMSSTTVTLLHAAHRLLTGGSRMALPRRQTLRTLIDWSYDQQHDIERSTYTPTITAKRPLFDIITIMRHSKHAREVLARAPSGRAGTNRRPRALGTKSYVGCAANRDRFCLTPPRAPDPGSHRAQCPRRFRGRSNAASAFPVSTDAHGPGQASAPRESSVAPASPPRRHPPR